MKQTEITLLLCLVLPACGEDEIPLPRASERDPLPMSGSEYRGRLPSTAREIFDLLVAGKTDGAWTLIEAYQQADPADAGLQAVLAQANLARTALGAYPWFEDPGRDGLTSFQRIRGQLQSAADLDDDLKPLLADIVFDEVIRKLLWLAQTHEGVLLSDTGFCSKKARGDLVAFGTSLQEQGSQDSDNLMEAMSGLYGSMMINAIRARGFEHYFRGGIWVDVIDLAQRFDEQAIERWEPALRQTARAFAREGLYASGAFLEMKLETLGGADPEQELSMGLRLLADQERAASDPERAQNLAAALCYLAEARPGALRSAAEQKNGDLAEILEILTRGLSPGKLAQVRELTGLTAET